MEKNEIVIGVPRVGQIYEGDPRPPPTATMLMNDGGSTLLTIPISNVVDSPYAMWYGHGIESPTNRSKVSTKAHQAPEQLLFFGGAVERSRSSDVEA